MDSDSPFSKTDNSTRHGITDPISLSGPSESEIQASQEMMNELREQNTFDSDDEARNREHVLGEVEKLAKQFFYRVSFQNRLSNLAPSASGGKIFIFGSYRLGVHGPGVDIDMLLVVPRHVSRDDFFRTFGSMLRELEYTTSIEAIPDAFVPIIKAKISGVEVDILCARVALSSVPDDLDLSNDSILENLDRRCIRSLGGPRVTDGILRLVPNVSVFRDALRCIRLWAKRRAIYSKIMGFLGGVAWAVLVARVCQLYPNQCSGVVVHRFFQLMYQWRWPHPVLLKATETGSLGLQVWNPKLYPEDRRDRMPIITPTYPAVCLTPNVTSSTEKTIIRELTRGAKITESIIRGESQWSELFAGHDFFTRYRHYIQVVASAPGPGALKKWSGVLEPKIRHLVTKFEQADLLESANPFVRAFDHVFHCMNDAEVSAIRAGKFLDSVAKRTQEDIRDSQQARSVWTASFFIGLEVAQKSAGSTGRQRLDLTLPIDEFKRMARAWSGYDWATMTLEVSHMKSAQLPDYVFACGVRPLLEKTLRRTKSDKLTPTIADDVPEEKKRRSSFGGTPTVEFLAPSRVQAVSVHPTVQHTKRAKTPKNRRKGGTKSAPTVARKVLSPAKREQLNNVMIGGFQSIPTAKEGPQAERLDLSVPDRHMHSSHSQGSSLKNVSAANWGPHKRRISAWSQPRNKAAPPKV